MPIDYSPNNMRELKHLLKARSLSYCGNKADLIARLEEDDSEDFSNQSTSPATSGEDVTHQETEGATISVAPVANMTSYHFPQDLQSPASQSFAPQPTFPDHQSNFLGDITFHDPL